MCKIKTTNIHNEFGLIFWRFSRVGHLQCLNDSCEYLSRSGRVLQSGSIFFPFLSWLVQTHQNKYKVQCKVCHANPICFDVCHAKIIYVHSQSSNMSRALYPLGCLEPPCVYWSILRATKYTLLVCGK